MKLYNFIRSGDKQLLREFISQNKIDSFENVLVQIFSGLNSTDDVLNIWSITKDIFPKIKIIGTTTAGEIYDGKYSDGKILISFSVFDTTRVKTTSIDFNRTGYDDSLKLLKNFVDFDTKAIIVFGDGFSPIVDNLLKDFFDFKPNIIVAGGNAGDNLLFNSSTIFTEKNILKKGIVIASLSGPDLIVNNSSSFGWMEIGNDMKISKSEGNRIYEIDGIPAIEKYKSNLGEEIADSIPELGIEFPLIITKSGMKIARTAIKKYDDGSIEVLGNTKEGEFIKFGIGHKEIIINNVIENYNNVIENFPVEGIYLYSCGGRKYYLKEDISTEIEIFGKIAPVSGFFTHGEYYHDNFDNYLLNYTFTTLVLSESKKLSDAPKHIEKIKIKDKVVYALSKASAKTQEQLIELNSNLQKEVEKQIIEKEHSIKEFMEGYKRIIDNVPLAIWMGNKDEETIHANSKFCELVETPLEEMLGKKSYIFWDSESTEVVKKNNQLRKSGEKSTYEGVLLSKYNNKIPVKLTGIPFVEGGTVGMMQDLRDLKRLEEEKKHLEKVNQMKDDFINIASHELRTPLTSIKGYLSMMQDGDFGQFSSELLDVFKIMYGSSERLIQLVNDMLDISKLESGKMIFKNEIQNLNILLVSIYDEYKNLSTQKGLNFHINIEEEFIVDIDKNRFKQVMINLLGNAIKFTPEGGNIIINAVKEVGVVRVEVVDTGIGIKKEDLGKIFEKFGQVDNVLTRKQQGTGLGLPIAKEILGYMGSDLLVESNQGEGSKFYFTLKIVN